MHSAAARAHGRHGRLARVAPPNTTDRFIKKSNKRNAKAKNYGHSTITLTEFTHERSI